MNYEIKALPQSVISKLRSGVNVSSVSQCVEELILNSIDAKASCVSIRLDLPYGKIQVVDNGVGIEKNQFNFIGERYHTSKCHNLDDMSNLGHYGFRGEALASLIEISGVFEVESRFRGCEETYDKIFLCKAKKKPQVTKKNVKRPSVGTTVTILDFMHSLPVRKSLICLVRDVEKCRVRIQAIALMHPDISFSLRNNSTGEICLEIKKCKDLLGTFRTLFGYQKGLNAKVIRFNRGEFGIEGLISVEGHYSKDLQFLYINKRLVLKTRLHTNVNHEIGKRLLARNHLGSSGSTQSPKKDKNPIFILNITCPLNIYDVTFEPSKTLVEFQNWDYVINIFEEFLGNFVKEHFGEVPEEEIVEIPANKDDLDEGITTTNVKNSMHSLPATRKSRTSNQNVPQPKTSQENLDQDTEIYVTPICQKRLKTLSPVTTRKSVSAFTCSLAEFTKRFRLEPNLKKAWKLPDPSPKIEKSTATSNIAVERHEAVGLRLKPEKNQKIEKKVQFSLKLNEDIHQNIEENILDSSPESTNTEPFTVTSPKHSSLSERIDNNNSLLGSEPFCITQPFEIESSLHKTIIKNSFESKSNKIDEISDFTINQNNQSRYFDKSTKSSCVSFLKKCDNSSRLYLSSQTIPKYYLPFKTKNLQTTEDFSPQSENEETGLNDISDSKSSSSRSFPSSVTIPIESPSDKYQILVTENQINQSSEDEMERNKTWFGTKNQVNQSCSCSQNSISRPVASLSRSQMFETEFSNEMEQFQTDDANNADSSDSSGNWMAQWQSLEDKLDSLFEKSGNPSLSQNNAELELGNPSLSQNNAELELTKMKTKENAENSMNWKSCRDPDTGSTMYINRNTGNSSFKLPEERKDTLTQSDLQKPKHYFLSHDSSPFQPRVDRNAHHRDEETVAKVSSVLKEWDNPVFESNSKEMNDVWELSKSDSSLKAYHSLCKYKFNKTMLQNVKVIRQIDDKFIACLITNEENEKLLVLFDQHAVHERIRLEYLTNDLYISDKIMKYTDMIPPLVLNLGREWVRLAHAYRDELKKLAINLLFNCTDVDHLSVCTAPTCFITRESNSLKRGRSTTLEANLTDLIKEQLTRIRDKTMGPSLPVTLQNILNSQACRGAIKFGDKLTMEECQELISTLSRCNLPFQCAHGRPSLVPLLNLTLLKDFSTIKKRPKYENLRKNNI